MTGEQSGVADADWARAAALLSRSRRPVLLCHVVPDGDALGSMLACLQALRSRGIEAVASWGEDDHQVPAAYQQLAGLEHLVPARQVPVVPELLVTFDAGSTERLGCLADRVPATLAAGGDVVVVDHHGSNTLFGTVNLVDPSAAATAVLVDRLLAEMDVPLTEPVAEALYVGLVTDTGSFRYSATTPQVHELAGRLHSAGIDHAEINRRIWDSNPFSYLALQGEVLCRARLEPDEVSGLGLVWSSCSWPELSKAGLGLDAIEGLIDGIRSADEAEVAVMCKQGEDGDWRVSLRSKGRVDVGQVGSLMGGGGHTFAAGFTSGDIPEQMITRLRTALAAAPLLDR